MSLIRFAVKNTVKTQNLLTEFRKINEQTPTGDMSRHGLVEVRSGGCDQQANVGPESRQFQFVAAGIPPHTAAIRKLAQFAQHCHIC